MSSQVVRSARWVTFGRVFAKSMAFAQMITLGRLIGPEQYPVFGVVLVVMGLIEVLTEHGLATALIRRPGAIDQYLDTTWSINIVRGLGLGAVLIGGGPLIAAFLKSPESAPLLQVMGLVPIIKGVENLASVTLARQFAFRPLVVTECLSSGLSLVVALAAFGFGAGIWSLVVGQVIYSLIFSAGSYVIAPQRPRLRFRWDLYRDLQIFGLWVMLSRYASATLTSGGAIAVTLFLPSVALSFYQYADQMTSAAIVEVSRIANRVVLPYFSQHATDSAQLLPRFQRAVFTVAQISGLICLVLASGATEIIQLLLGDAWQECVALILPLSLWGFCRSIGACISGFLMATNRPREASTFQLVMVAAFLIGVYPAATWFQGTGIAWLLAIIGIFTGFWRLRRIATLLEVKNSMVTQWPALVPLAAASLSFSFVQLVSWLLEIPNAQTNPAGILFGNLALCATCYVSLLFFSTSIFGLPNETLRLLRSSSASRATHAKVVR